MAHLPTPDDLIEQFVADARRAVSIWVVENEVIPIIRAAHALRDFERRLFEPVRPIRERFENINRAGEEVVDALQGLIDALLGR